MNTIEILKLHSKNVGTGIDKTKIRDLEMRMGITIPEEYRNFLLALNYAELYGDPIYGIHKNNLEIDLYEQNSRKEHFRYGFLEMFNNDIDGTIFIRSDNGKIYNASFMQPIAESFNEFILKIINE